MLNLGTFIINPRDIVTRILWNSLIKFLSMPNIFLCCFNIGKETASSITIINVFEFLFRVINYEVCYELPKNMYLYQNNHLIVTQMYLLLVAR